MANVRAYASTPTALTTRCAESSPRGAASEIVVALATDEFPKSSESIAACHPPGKEAAHGLASPEDVRLARRLRRAN
jgi:hypothetical protein